MNRHATIDAFGKDLQVGDWVRVLMAPLSIGTMPDETKDAFSRAIGNSFQIQAFNEYGCLELDMWPKAGSDTIWLEPYCVRRFRRYRRLSISFRKKLEQRAAPPPPSYEIEFDIVARPGVDVEEFGHRLTSFASGGGFACWLDERRIRGSVRVEKVEPGAVEILEHIRRYIAEADEFEFYEVGEVTEVNES